MTDAINQASIATSEGYRFIPAPETSSTFDTIMNIVRGISGMIPSSSVLGGASGEIGSQYQDLITLQLEAQKQMMLVSMVSNVEKSKHETQMAPVRNIRVG